MSQDNIILTLLNILVGNQVDTDAVIKSLKLICQEMDFDCGLIYETDTLGQFCLMEHFALQDVHFHEQLTIDEVKKYDCLEKKSFTYLHKNSKITSAQMKLLDSYKTTSLAITPMVDENNFIQGYLIFLKTSTEPATDIPTLSGILSILTRYVGIRMYQKKLQQAQSTLENILDNTGIDIYVNDFYTHEILYVNKPMAAPYGGQDLFMGRMCWQVLFPGQTGPCEFCPQKKLIDEQGNPTKVYSWDYQRAFDGSWFRVFSTAFRWVDGRLAHVVSSADITDNKRNEALIEHMANYDQLTNLPNRRMLVAECERRINNATATEQGYLLFFDIDRFKLINDTLGHDAGDEFLIQLGEFFSSIPLIKDSTYRNGGDEFVAVVGGESVSKDNIKNLVSFILKRFDKPWNLKKGPVTCNCSIGIACYPEDGKSAELLLQKSDAAMYYVKKSGGAGWCFGYQLNEK